MSDFENKIKSNLAFFESQEPDEGHRERFIQRLDKKDPRKRIINFSLFGNIAAAVIITVTVGFLAINHFKEAKTENLYITQIAYSEDMMELQDYYDRLSIEKLNNIDNVATDNNEADRLKKKALKKMDKLDANLAMIEKEYAKNPECKKLKKAIIDNKKKKVEVVDNIVEQASNAKKGYHVGTMLNEF